MQRTSDNDAWFEEMRTWPDGWNGYNALAPRAKAIDQAKEWLTKLQFVIAPEEWIEPTFITGTADGGVTIEWREGKQGVSFYFEGQPSIDYLKVWGSNCTEDMADGEITTLEESLAIWEWMLEEDEWEKEQWKPYE